MPDETEVTTLGEQEDEPDRPVETDIVTFEEQDTRSLLRPVPRRASPHDDLSFAESQHVLFDEAEDPRSLLRPVPPNETRDEDSVEDVNLRDTAGVPSKHGSTEGPCTRLRPVPRRESPHDDSSAAEEQRPPLKHGPCDEAEDPRPSLRPVLPNDTRDGGPVELNLRGSAGVPSQPSSTEDPCTRLRPVPRRKSLHDDLSVAEESPQIPSLKHVPSDEHAVRSRNRGPR